MHSGWFKFHRQIFDNPICAKDAEYFFVWVWILSEANYEETRVWFKNKDIVLEKGQLLTSVRKISEKLKINRSKVERILKALKSEEQIDIQTSTKNTLITVLKWEKYQASETQNETQVRHERDTSETRVRNLPIKKEIKNIRNKEYKKDAVYFPDDERLNRAFCDFVDMRKKIKAPMTDNAIKLAISKLEKLSQGNNEYAIEILNQSIMNSYKGLFPVKGKEEPQINNVFDEWRNA